MKRRNLLKFALITPVVASAYTKLSVSEVAKPTIMYAKDFGAIPDQGAACDLVVFDRVLSPQEIYRTHSYLIARYAI